VTREYSKIKNPCEKCETEFVKGDLVYCALDPLYLTESAFDCGRFGKDIGIITEISFYKEGIHEHFRSFIVCELSIYWCGSDKVTCHLDKYIRKLESEKT